MKQRKQKVPYMIDLRKTKGTVYMNFMTCCRMYGEQPYYLIIKI